MTIWTTFSPQKICWEITTVKGKGSKGDGNWLMHIPLIEQALRLLRNARISGIRLVIYPNEITQDGERFDWKPVETMLALCKKHKLQVDFCVGPFQYPNYPGIYLPNALVAQVFNNTRSLDTTHALREFGERFLQKQLERYGEDKRIHGFHFANEWPDKQRVQGREKVKTWISEAFMVWCAQYLKEHTQKPIALNTNIDASDKHRLKTALKEILMVLGDQGRLGFDVYPSQETWRKAPLQKLHRWWEPYHRSFWRAKRQFPQTKFYFCEVEAQPWGDGRSWFHIISNEHQPQQKVLQYSRESLSQTFRHYIKKSSVGDVSLWGADFWLAAYEMGLTWPLEQIKHSHKYHLTLGQKL